jgi:hypothetical protein
MTEPADAEKQERHEATERVREHLAAYAHAAWGGWMRYMFSLGVTNEDGSFTIAPGHVQRWHRQMNTLYADLPPNEQWSDQLEADKMLALMGRQYLAVELQCIHCLWEGPIDSAWRFNGTLWEHQCTGDPQVGHIGIGVPTKLRGEA